MQPISPLNWRHLLAALPRPLVLAFALIVAVGSYVWLPLGGLDWRSTIGPATRFWFTEPWAQGWPVAPWAPLLISPLGALPDRLATALLNGASVVALAVVIRRLGGRDWLAIPLLVSPLGFWLCRNGQVDAVILLSLLVTNGLELLIVIAKPQVAVGVVVSRLRRAGPRWPVYLAPLLVGGLLSLVIWPGWPLAVASASASHVGVDWNSAAWPYGVPFGLALLWAAWRRGDDGLALLATPLLFPFVNAPSYLGALAVVAARWPHWLLWVWAVSLAMTLWVIGAAAGIAPMALTLGGIIAVLAAVAAGAQLTLNAWRRRRHPLPVTS